LVESLIGCGRWLALVDVVSLEWLRLRLGEVWTSRNCDSSFTLGLVQLVLEVILHTFELVGIDGLVDPWLESEVFLDDLLRILLCIKSCLLHAAWHLGASIAFFCLLLDLLLTLQLLLLQVFLVEWE